MNGITIPVRLATDEEKLFHGSSIYEEAVVDGDGVILTIVAYDLSNPETAKQIAELFVKTLNEALAPKKPSETLYAISTSGSSGNGFIYGPCSLNEALGFGGEDGNTIFELNTKGNILRYIWDDGHWE